MAHETLDGRHELDHAIGAMSCHADATGILATMVRKLACTHVVAIGAGNRELSRPLATLGLDVIPIEVRTEASTEEHALDLSSRESGAWRSIRERIEREHAAGPRLTCCLQVLEEIDREGLARAVWNLREVSGEWLLVSMSTRPSGDEGRDHATVVPSRVWRKLFEASGFRVIREDLLDRLASAPHAFDGADNWRRQAWRRADPFRDAISSEPFYLLLHREPMSVSFEGLDAQARMLLGLPVVRRLRPGLPRPDTHLGFLVSQFEDFLEFLPFWDAIDRESVRAIVVGGDSSTIDPTRLRVILGYLTLRRIPHEVVTSSDEVSWTAPERTRRALLVALGPNTAKGRVPNTSFLAAAREEGYRTFQLQRGLPPRDTAARLDDLPADHVLVWSEPSPTGFSKSQEGLRAELPRSRFDQDRIQVTGCSAFDEYQWIIPVRMADLLGDWVVPFRRSVLIATNFGLVPEAPLWQALCQLAERRPDVLFVTRLHPMDDPPESLFANRPPNVLPIDAVACMYGQLSTPRLVMAADAVVGTCSTVLLQAALAGKPFAQVHTADIETLSGVAPVPVEELETAVTRLLLGSGADGGFSRLHHDRSTLGYGLPQALEAIERGLDSPHGSRCFPGRNHTIG